MFNTLAFTMIDAVQSGKKQFVNYTVFNSDVRNALNSFIDSQTEYTKSMVESTTSTSFDLVKAFFPK